MTDILEKSSLHMEGGSLYEVKHYRTVNERARITIPGFGGYLKESGLDFEGLLAAGYREAEPYRSLQRLKRMMKAGGSVLLELSPEVLNSHNELAFILSCLGFELDELIGERLLRVKKRAPLKRTFSQTSPVTVKEIETEEEMELFYGFLRKIYDSNFQQDLNYRREIDELFENHSEFVLTYNSADPTQVYAIGRNTWHLPGRLLPLQLAEKRGGGRFSLGDSSSAVFYEPLSIYDFSLPARLRPPVFYETSRMQLQLAARKRRFYNVEALTTYEANSPDLFEMYSKKLGCSKVSHEGEDVVLTYGDLGLDWGLIKVNARRFNHLTDNLDRLNRSKNWEALGI